MDKHHKIHERIRQKAVMRKRKRRKVIERRFNLRYRRKPKYNRRRYNSRGWGPKHYEAIAPSVFNISNIAEIVSFVQKTEKFCRMNKVNYLKVNLDHVVMIDMYAISLLLSMLNKLSCHNNIRYWGTYPDNVLAKRYICDSGFLDLVRTNIKKPEDSRKGNQIFMVGKDSVDSHRIGKSVRESMKYIINQEAFYPPVYDNMCEISSNSVEHANVNSLDKNWLISISIENKKIRYILTDTGSGILNTLKKKISQKIGDAFSNKSDATVLEDVFLKYYQSVTGEINRHKGLPNVYESFIDGFISNFQVLTNKVMIDFETKKVLNLRKGFNGVMFSWTVSIDNYNNWKNSL